MTNAVDLSGRWTGVYFYPWDEEMNPFDDLPPTPFSAELVDVGGRISGSTIEPDLLGEFGQSEIPAILEGHHADGVLTFSKFPEGEGHDDPIAYTGAISSDGNSITGEWMIVGDWSGTFQMQRRVAQAAAERSLSASV